jgi:hypothetical protein
LSAGVLGRSRVVSATLAFAFLAYASIASAHISSNGFLDARVEGTHITGSFELAVRDAELAVGIDANQDSKVTWGELRASQSRLEDYLRGHLSFAAQRAPCALDFGAVEVTDRVDGIYAFIPFAALCPTEVRQLSIGYQVLEGIDPSHRGLLALAAGNVSQTGVLAASSSDASFSLFAPSRLRAFLEYYRAGIWHILSGIDHLLFLLSLLLPAVLLRRNRRWEPVTQARPALLDILKVVTAFTLAHSITLSLAALNVVRLPSRLTESIIAASIIVAALNNVFPLVTGKRARIAFAFGLLHGFGFASVLADMGLPQGARVTSLLAFNLGIETGQLAVVLAVMPIMYVLRTGRFYRHGLMPWGSAAIAVIAFVWLIQRAVLPLG